MWGYLVAAVLALHASIHALGFFATWRIGRVDAVAASPNLLASLTAGSQPVLALGVLWLVAKAVFLVSAIGLALNALVESDDCGRCRAVVSPMHCLVERRQVRRPH